jgi:sugar phosphate isomerase/epimerase
MKIGLYSITYLGIWYQGRALTMTEVIDRAASLGFDGIEIDGKRPHGNPLDWNARTRHEVRELCAARGLEIVGVAANNDFSSPIPEHRECQLLMVRELIRLCRDLGGRVVRVFLAWPGVTLDSTGLAAYDHAKALWHDTTRYTTRHTQWRAARACLQEAARYAEEDGVTVALQNHRPLLRDYRDMLAMIAEVGSPALRASLDVPLLDRQDAASVWQAVRATGSLQAVSHYNGEFERGPDGRVRERPYDHEREIVNHPAFIRALKETGYDGYLSFEFCHPSLTPQHEPVGLPYIDEQTALALEYMRDMMVAEGVYTGRAAPRPHAPAH